MACGGWAWSWRSCRPTVRPCCVRAWSNCDIVYAAFPLERLRACKTPEEIEYLREFLRARRGVDAGDLCAVQAGHEQAGGQRDAPPRGEPTAASSSTTRLLTAGTSLNRAPSEQRLGARRHSCRSTPAATITGYIGDLVPHGASCGAKPDAELERSCWAEHRGRAARGDASRSSAGGPRRRRSIGAAEPLAACDSRHRNIHALPGARHGARHTRGAAADEQPRACPTPATTWTGCSRAAW